MSALKFSLFDKSWSILAVFVHSWIYLDATLAHKFSKE